MEESQTNETNETFLQNLKKHLKVVKSQTNVRLCISAAKFYENTYPNVKIDIN